MTKFKGTQGKWYIQFMGDDPKEDFWVKSDVNDVVHYGTDIMAEDFGPQNGYTREQRMADAKAIAQVPEMVKLLERMVAKSEDDWTNQFGELFLDAEEILKKIL
jgi:hypothetical protein